MSIDIISETIRPKNQTLVTVFHPNTTGKTEMETRLYKDSFSDYSLLNSFREEPLF